MTEVQAPYNVHQQDFNKIYIAGPITGVSDYKESFDQVEEALTDAGHLVMNPAIPPEGFDWSEYMKICIPMLGCCDVIVLLDGWQNSKGARAELLEAVRLEMRIVFQCELNKLTDINAEPMGVDYEYYTSTDKQSIS